MPRSVANKIYRTFTAGLITEASPLTYPENATTDEDNCILYRKGNRSRRLGMDFEEDFVESIYYLNADGTDTDDHRQAVDVAIKSYKWENVGNGTLNLLVYQQGRYIQFFDMSFEPLSAGYKPYFVDLQEFLAPGATEVEKTEVSMAAGRGILYVCGPKIDPFYVTYLPDIDDITRTRIAIQVRDFQGVNDSLANDEEPIVLTAEHHYNLRNQGWIDQDNGSGTTEVSYYDEYSGTYQTYTTTVGGISSPISQYYGSLFRYPGNNKQWFTGKDGNGDFQATLLNKFFSGNNRAPRGHFILNAFYEDRSAVSGVAGLPVVSTNERPSSCAFYAGRIWYVFKSTVYFSQVLDSPLKAGRCYQEADPTSEDISDLVATDGGVVPIPEMGRGVRLFPAGSGLLVFSTNGIWAITGTQAGFSATDMSVSKVSGVGTEAANSIVEAGGPVFYWSKSGICAISPKTGMFGSVEGVYDIEVVSETTIQSFYNDEIDEESKLYAQGAYDPITNTIQWLFRSDTSTPNRYFFDRVLNYDLTLKAFYPWTVTTRDAYGPYICSIFITPKINIIETNQPVVAGGVTVEDIDGAEVTAMDFEVSVRASLFKYLTVFPRTTDGVTEWTFTFGYFRDTNFVDWASGVATDNGFTYNSYMETGYELLEDSMRKKQIGYVFCYFRRTEENYLSNEIGDYVFDRPSSCLFQTKWDWADTVVSGKWSREVQAYRLTRLPIVSSNDLEVDTGFPIVISKNKVRGSGRAIQFRFSCEERRKDFDLLGWAVSYSGNTQP